MKYIDSGKLKAEIEQRNLANYCGTAEQYEEELFALLDTLEEETSYDTQKYTPSPSVDIGNIARVQFASHAKVFDKKRKAVFDWEQFKEVAGIFYGFGKKDTLSEDDALQCWKEVHTYTEELREGDMEKMLLDLSVGKGKRETKIALPDKVVDSISEEPVSEDLEEAAEKYAIEYAEREKPKDADGEIWKVGDVMIENRMSFEDGFKAGAEWQEKRWENNRLMAQDKATEEECQREMDFVDNHIKKHHRIPTFSDAINYGIEWQKKQMPLPEDTLIFRKGVKEGKRLMMEEAVEGFIFQPEDYYPKELLAHYDGELKHGDKVRIIILPKEEEK